VRARVIAILIGILASLLSTSLVFPSSVLASPLVGAVPPPLPPPGSSPLDQADPQPGPDAVAVAPRTITPLNGSACSDFTAVRRKSLMAKNARQYACIDPTSTPNLSTPSLTPQSGVSAQALQTYPSWCTTTWMQTRLTQCRMQPTGISVRDSSTGGPVGFLAFKLGNLSYTANNSLTWGHQTDILYQNADSWGLVGNSYASGTASCVSVNTQVAPCSRQSGSFPATSVNPNFPISAEAFFNSTISSTVSGSLGTSATSWFYTFTNTAWNPVTFSSQSSPVRCDNATPGRSAGCVNSSYTPYIVYSRTGAYSELARHIGDAQVSGLPGAYPSGTPLTRLLTGDDSKDNRDTACPDTYTRPTTPFPKSCDEYPFASSNQGASTTGGSGRTFSYCSIPQLRTGITGPLGYSACMISATQNSTGGSLLGAFYGNNRVISNDYYRVSIAA
jgi:hypothetical protein